MQVGYEIKLAKQLNEIRNLRHAGLYVDKEGQKKADDSEIYDWIVDIDLITNVIMFYLDGQQGVGCQIL